MGLRADVLGCRQLAYSDVTRSTRVNNSRALSLSTKPNFKVQNARVKCSVDIIVEMEMRVADVYMCDLFIFLVEMKSPQLVAH